MPFTQGNKLGVKARVFERTLRRVIHQNPDKIRKIAEKLIEMAAGGNLGAINELVDRLDGKAPQTVSVSQKITIEDADSVRSKLAATLEKRSSHTVQ